jgi:hypothetical protein
VTGVSDREIHWIQYCVRPRLRRGSGTAARLVLSALTGLAIVACGSSERTFTAQEFVEELDARGATLELGQKLSTDDPDAELYAVENPEEKHGGGHESEQAEEEHGHAHSGGSLRVTESASRAEEEFQRCEGAVTLLCYRAANVVLVFEQEADPEFLGRLTVAISALAAE